MDELDFNVLIGNAITERDKELIFCGKDEKLEDLKFFTFPETIRWPQLLRELGIFSSASQAVGCGWNKDIEAGFSEVEIGKLHKHITILKWTLNEERLLHET